MKSIGALCSKFRFTVEWFETQFGGGAAHKKQLKGFLKGLLNLMNDVGAPAHDYAMLFGQMAGCWTESERIKPLPNKASERLLHRLDEVSGRGVELS